MGRNDNPHACRLNTALQQTAGDEAAGAFALEHPLSKSADIERKFAWAQAVCGWLAEHTSKETARLIRRECRCGDGHTMAREIKACIARAGSLSDGCKLFTEKNKYAFLEYISDRELLFGYHACVCSCIKRAEGLIPRLWCECSCGYAEAMLKQVFGESVHVELLGSVKAGDQRCKMRVTIR